MWPWRDPYTLSCLSALVKSFLPTYLISKGLKGICCVYAHVYDHVQIHSFVCVYLCVFACRSQSLTSSVCSYHLPYWFFVLFCNFFFDGLSLNLELTFLKLTDLTANPRNLCLCPAPQQSGCRFAPLSSSGWCWGSELWSSGSPSSKYVTHWAISPALLLNFLNEIKPATTCLCNPPSAF